MVEGVTRGSVSGLRLCPKCKVEKSVTEFWASRGGKDGLQSRCKLCKGADNYAWRCVKRNASTPIDRGRYKRLQEEEYAHVVKYRVDKTEYRRRWNLAKRYGITINDYASMLESQGGGCAICGVTEGRLVVDHCHKTQKNRGILCVRCNVSIGALGDDSQGLMVAVKYLERAEGEL